MILINYANFAASNPLEKYQYQANENNCCAELKEVLEMIDRLNPGDLAIVQEKIVPSQIRRWI